MAVPILTCVAPSKLHSDNPGSFPLTALSVIASGVLLQLIENRSRFGKYFTGFTVISLYRCHRHETAQLERREILYSVYSHFEFMRRKSVFAFLSGNIGLKQNSSCNIVID